MRNFMLLFTDPSRTGESVLLSILFAASMSVSVLLDAKADEQEVDIDNVTRAIKWLLRDAPGRRLAKSEETQREIAEAVFSAGKNHDIPPLLLLAMAHRESSLHLGATGKLGERGLMQVHGAAAEGCDLDTYGNQVSCGAAWLRRCINECGDIEGGIALYGSGKSCALPRGSSRAQMVRSRIRLWKKLEQVAR